MLNDVKPYMLNDVKPYMLNDVKPYMLNDMKSYKQADHKILINYMLDLPQHYLEISLILLLDLCCLVVTGKQTYHKYHNLIHYI